MRDLRLFEKAVESFFGPLARNHGLSSCKASEGAYEFRSGLFVMRVRLDTGHARGINVLLRPTSLHDFDESKPSSEYGIANFMLLHGERPECAFIDVNTDEDFLTQAQLLAKAAERLLVPVLVGDSDDFRAVEELVKRRTAEDVEKIKQYRFPKNVREEWL